MRTGLSVLGKTAEPASDFHRDLRQALTSTTRSIPPKYFYDAAGSALFDLICGLPEYYPTRTELGILQHCGADIAARIGPGAEIIEFGAGSLSKIRLLLDALEAPRRYLPIDISGEHLAAATRRLRADYPLFPIEPIIADYAKPFTLPPAIGGRRVGFFPGSTIGNFNPEEAKAFLKNAAGLLRGGGLLVGADLVKDPAILHAAYNDADGITAAFNLNLLNHANTELGTDFDLAGFYHYAFYNAPLARIEMHLLSKHRQTVTLGRETFTFREGESLHTENSHKFTIDGFRSLARKAGFKPDAVWTDPARQFSVHWLQAPV